MNTKVYPDAASALEGVIREGMTLMCGGFGACGIPENLIDALHASRIGNLTVVSNNAGLDGVGLGLLLQTRQIRKMISSYVGENKEFERQYLAGELELEFNPQGTLGRAHTRGRGRHLRLLHQGGCRHAGRRRQGNASSWTARPMCSRRGWWPTCRWSRHGRAIPRAISSTARPRAISIPIWRPPRRCTIAEVEELVPVGSLDPDNIHTPGIFVQRIIQGPRYTKLIEKRTVRKREEKSNAVVA